MPRQPLSLRPQRLVLSGKERDQNEFISAKFDGQGQEFLAHAFNIWFARWPLKLSDFEDEDFMRHRRQSIEKVSNVMIICPDFSECSVRVFPTVYGGLVSLKCNRSILGSDTWPSARLDMEFPQEYVPICTPTLLR